MSYRQFDRFAVKMEPLSSRTNKKFIDEDHISHDAVPQPLPAAATELIAELAQRIQIARREDRPVMITFGAHTIKNGLGARVIALTGKGLGYSSCNQWCRCHPRLGIRISGRELRAR